MRSNTERAISMKPVGASRISMKPSASTVSVGPIALAAKRAWRASNVCRVLPAGSGASSPPSGQPSVLCG